MSQYDLKENFTLKMKALSFKIKNARNLNLQEKRFKTKAQGCINYREDLSCGAYFVHIEWNKDVIFKVDYNYQFCVFFFFFTSRPRN